MLFSQVMISQGSPDYDGGFMLKLDDDGKKILRILSWIQVQGIYNDQVDESSSKVDFKLRRARILMYSKINDKFLILTHFGLNSLDASNMSATGIGDNSQLFLHDAWVQYNMSQNHSIGAGLHYFNGISRLNNQGTLNMLTLDNNRQSWSTIGLSDQFGRHIGVFLKGNFNKLQYRLAINDAITNSLDVEQSIEYDANGNPLLDEQITYYAGKKLLGSKDAGKCFSGYLDYHFLDQESNFLPYKTGTYLGSKRVFNIGAGFFAHPNGAVRLEDGNLKGDDVFIFAVDAFYDAPLNDKSAITAYATFQSNNYGKNYLSSVYGSGLMVYGHLGYVLPTNFSKTRFQPFLSFASHDYDAITDDKTILGFGFNTYFNGHNSKLTLEYKNQSFGSFNENTLTLQAMIYL